MQFWIVVELIVGGLVAGFIVGALVMRRHYDRIRKAEETLKGVKL